MSIKLLNQGTSLKCRISGNSMAPLLKEGDLVTVVSAEKVRIGDIIVFGESQLLVHRLVKFLNSEKVLTKGDKNLTLDAPLAKEKIIGKVIAIHKRDKTVLIEGRLRTTLNFLIAKYSLALALACELVSSHKCLVKIGRKIWPVVGSILWIVPKFYEFIIRQVGKTYD